MADNASTTGSNDYETQEGAGSLAAPALSYEDDLARARRLHHLATADPEPERGDGTLTGPAHERKYGLERAESSAAAWRARGVHPTENRALVEGEDGAENVRGVAALDNTAAPSAPENTAAPSASS